MFSRPPEAAPPPYLPGYLAFPPAGHHNAVAQETHLFNERIRLHRENLKAGHQELERAQVTGTTADSAWLQAEEARRARRAKLKEEIVKAELEWERMGGKVRDMDAADAELRRKFDADESLTDEERILKRSWDEYDKAWDRLMGSIRPAKTFTFRKLTFTFAEIPWPVACASLPGDTGSLCTTSLEDITGKAVARFLLHPLREPQKSRREKLREAILRYHPDKFEGRVLPRVVAEDRIRVQEAIGIVMKCLNELMNAEA